MIVKEMAMSTKVTIMKNGPVLVKGEFVVSDPEGKEYDLGGKDTVAFCRCGQSTNKPYCDGSHNHHGFEHDPKAF